MFLSMATLLHFLLLIIIVLTLIEIIILDMKLQGIILVMIYYHYKSLK